MSMVHLFYGTQLVASFEGQDATPKFVKNEFGQEIYDGGYIYASEMNTKWWRCDLTPCLLNDVPKELRALALLII